MPGSPNKTQTIAGAIFAQTLVIITVSLFIQAQKAAPALPPLSADAIVGKLIAANMRRARELRGYTAKRSYHVDYRGFPGSRDAAMQVETSYSAPDKKDFKVVSQTGSQFLITHIFQKLLNSEQEYLKQDIQEQSELSPRNYDFSLAGTDIDADGQYYVLDVSPKHKSQFLYRGKIWVDAHDFAVARIQGEPAKNPSFWISHTSIDHHYKKFGDFWLPVHNESVTQVRLGGKATLTIDYDEYQVSSSKIRVAHATETDAVLPPPTSVTADPH
jgi:hypothetical protein